MSKSERLLEALSKVVKMRRDEAGLSQTELADRAKLHRTYISNIERGTQNISLDILSRIAEALGTTVTDLISNAESTARKSITPIRILLIEDNPSDVFMFKRCLERNDLPAEVDIFNSGQKASDHIKKLDETGGDDLPEIVFLDLNLPGKSGHEILRELKSSQHLKHIPVIILTTSSNPKDIEKTYNHFVNSYLTKPIDPMEFEESITRVLDYWFGTSAIPQRKRI